MIKVRMILYLIKYLITQITIIFNNIYDWVPYIKICILLLVNIAINVTSA